MFEAIARRGDEAEAADVMLLPRVGFDVVPTDCLAAHLAERLPDATRLALGFDAPEGLSPGTAKTVVENLGAGGAVRREGRIERVPTAWKSREIDFGDGATTAMTIPWGDVSTAYHTSGIPNVEFYTATHPRTVRTLRVLRRLGPVLEAGPVQALLQRHIDARVEGPDERERETGRSQVWSEVETPDGERAMSRLETPHTCELTVRTALEPAQRVVDGDARPGFRTPAGACGPDLILEVEGVERTDENVA